jgi:hypothetical protein
MKQELPTEFKSLLSIANFTMVYSPPVRHFQCSSFPFRTMFLTGGNNFSVFIEWRKSGIEVANIGLNDYEYLLRIFKDIAFMYQGDSCYLVDERCAYAINDFQFRNQPFRDTYNEFMFRMRKQQRIKERGIMNKLNEMAEGEIIKKASYNSFVIETEHNTFDIPTHIMLAKSDSIIELLKTKYLSKTKEKLAFIGKLGVMK